MSGWPTVRLEDCAEIVAGATPSTSAPVYWGGDICWATPKDLSELEGAYISDTPRKITRSGLQSCAATVLPPDSVLFSSRAPIGHVAINTVPMATNQGFKSFVPNCDRLHAKFLYHWLRRNRPYLESLGNGATFKEVSKAVVSRIEIPVPPLPEQRRIAAILDKADALRAKRRAALAQLDTLTQSIFLDMFGDPTVNSRDWPVRPLREVGQVITGSTPPRASPHLYGDAIEWIKSDNINGAPYFVSPSNERLSEAGRHFARVVPSNSILVTCIAGSPSCIGNAAMTDREVAFNQQINAVVPERHDPHFLLALLRAAKQLVQNAASSGMKGMVSKSRFESVLIIDPPAVLQAEFGRRALAVREVWLSQSTACAGADALFTSLQHRAFRGEL
jgi:type I restriction enzyme, S subunit